MSSSDWFHLSSIPFVVEFKTKGISSTSWALGVVTELRSSEVVPTGVTLLNSPECHLKREARNSQNAASTTGTQSSGNQESVLTSETHVSSPLYSCWGRVFPPSISASVEPIWVALADARFPANRAQVLDHLRNKRIIQSGVTGDSSRETSTVMQKITDTCDSTYLTKFDPQVGQPVEALWLTDIGCFPHWDIGIIQRIDHETFYTVRFENRNNQCQIFQLNQLRPVSTVPTFSEWFQSSDEEQPVTVELVEISVPLRAKISLLDSDPNFFSQSISSSSSIFNVIIHNCTNNHQCELSGNVSEDLICSNGATATVQPSFPVKLIGTKDDILLVQTLIKAKIKSAMDSAAFQERRTRRLRLLEGRRSRNESSESVEFFVHDGLVGIVIGKQGDNLSKVARQWKVEVRVLPDEGGSRRVRMYGTDIEKVSRARIELEQLYFEVPLPTDCRDFLDWLLGPGGPLIREACSRLMIHSFWFDQGSHSLIICGILKSIDDLCSFIHEHYESYCSHTSTMAAVGGGSAHCNSALLGAPNALQLANWSNNLSKKDHQGTYYCNNLSGGSLKKNVHQRQTKLVL